MIIYRTVEDVAELDNIVELQKKVWAADNITSCTHMVAAILHGGVVIGAFDEDRAVGFCYGFAGFDGRCVYLNSHMMAVHPDYRDSGIGMKLKLEQRSWAIRHGYTKIVWTFDPLLARNAYLNISKLGGYVRKYIVSLYGTWQTKLPSDRFLVEWDLESGRVLEIIGQTYTEQSNGPGYRSLIDYEVKEERIVSLQANPVSGGAGYLVPVPASLEGMLKDQFLLVQQWQAVVRESCLEAFSRNYRITGMIRNPGPVHHYVLERDNSQSRGEE